MTDDTQPALGIECEPLVRIEETFDAPRERVFDAWGRRSPVPRCPLLRTSCAFMDRGREQERPFAAPAPAIPRGEPCNTAIAFRQPCHEPARPRS